MAELKNVKFNDYVNNGFHEGNAIYIASNKDDIDQERDLIVISNAVDGLSIEGYFIAYENRRYGRGNFTLTNEQAHQLKDFFVNLDLPPLTTKQ